MPEDRELKAMDTVLAAIKPLKGDARKRVLDWVASRAGVEAPEAFGGGGSGGRGAGDEPGGGQQTEQGSLGTPKEFVKSKQPFDDVLRVTTLAFYLMHGKGNANFKSADLNSARTEAAMASFNVSRATSNAQRAGFLTNVGKRGTLQITADGEAVVEGLPDKQKVKEVRAQRAKKRRKSSKSAKRTSTAKRTSKA